MSTAARRHTISNTTQPMDAAMAMVEEEEGIEGLLFPSSCIVVSGENSVVSGSGGVVVPDDVGAVIMVSGEQAALSP